MPPSDDPNLGNATFPGYYSVLRNGWWDGYPCASI